MTMAHEISRAPPRSWSFRKNPPDKDRGPSRDPFAWARRAVGYIVTFRPLFADVAPVAIGGLVAIALPALVAVATASRFGDIQIEVGDVSPTLGKPVGRVTTIAWTNQEGGPLTIGTSGGFLINVRRDGTPVQPSGAPVQRYAPGPIVEIFPSDRGVTADGVWVSAAGGYAGYRVGTEATYRGFAYRSGGSLKGVPPTAADGKGRQDPLIDFLMRRGPIARQSTGQVELAGPARLTALATLGDEAGRYVVAGHENGAVGVFRASGETVLEPITTHAGPVLAIATEAAAKFATAAADGTVSVYRLPDASATKEEFQEAVFESEAPGAIGGSQLARTGPVPRREGLLFDRSGRVLLLWDQGGGVSVARLGTVLPHIFRRYPLVGIPRFEPDRSLKAVQNALRDLGLYDGELDGIPGPRTLRALSAFQTRAGLSWIPPGDTDQTRAGRGWMPTDVTDRLAAVLLPTVWATAAVALSPRGDLFAVAGTDGVVRVVTLPTNPFEEPSAARTMALLGHSALVTRIAISPDGRMLASLDTTGRLLITDLDRLLGMLSLPLAAFSTAPLPGELEPLPVDIATFLKSAATVAGPRRFVICEGEFENRCRPFQYDIFVGCYQADSRISKLCEGRSSQRVQIRPSEPGNRCGYSWYNVSC